MKKPKLSVRRGLFIIFLLTTIMLFVSISALWIYSEIRRNDRELNLLKENLMSQHKILIKNKVENVVTHINFRIRTDTITQISDMQNQILNWVATMHFEYGGYIFINTYDGNALIFDGKKISGIKDISNITDSDGLRLFDKELQLAHKKNGGYFKYKFKKMDTDIEEPKISYIRGYDKWEWIIGAGVYFNDIDKELTKHHEKFKDELKGKITIIIAIFLFVIIAFLFLTFFIKNYITKEFNVFHSFFKNPANKNIFINKSKLKIHEFKDLANIANTMIEERDKMDIELSEKNIQYRMLVDNSLSGFYITQNHILKFCNKRFAEIFSYDLPEDIIGVPIKNIVTKESWEKIQKEVEERKEGKKTFSQYEIKAIDKNGKLFDAEVLGGKIIYQGKLSVQGTLLDITKRKKAIEKLELNNKSLILTKNISDVMRKAINLLSVAEASVNALLKHTDASSVVMFTYNKINNKINYIYSQGFPKEALKAIKQFRIDESLTGYSIKTKKVQFSINVSNDEKYKHTTKVTLINSNVKTALSIPCIYQNEVLGIINLIFDGKKEFNKTEIETFSSIGQMIGIKFSNAKYLNDLEQKIIEHEQSKERYKELAEIEKKRSEELQKSHIELEQAQDASLNMLNDLNEEINIREKAEKELAKHRDNLEKLINERTEELGISNNSLTLLMEDVIDINSKLNKTNAQLDIANKELESFSYSVSHDLRAPLRTIKGFSNAILEDYPNELNKDATNYFKQIVSATNNMSQLIDDLLKLSRVNKSYLIIERIDIGKLSEEIFNELKKINKNEKIKIKIQKNLIVNADRNLVRIMLNNLISNSIKFTSTKEKPVIEIGKIDRTNEENEKIITEYFIKDNGVGFDNKYSDNLFACFKRLHSDTKFEGSGIGLAIVNRIINRHKGTIRGEGIPNKEAIFYFRF
ncbi:MAG: cache domain-containing protein [Bacteroidota bacterium]|nr:cache domain-containing protein [Bacteroidota bacterium]